MMNISQASYGYDTEIVSVVTQNSITVFLQPTFKTILIFRSQLYRFLHPTSMLKPPLLDIFAIKPGKAKLSHFKPMKLEWLH